MTKHARLTTVPSADRIDLTRRRLTRSLGSLAVAAACGVAPAGSAIAASRDAIIREWGDPNSLVSGIAAGTLSVPSVAETVGAYTSGFGYVELWNGRIPREVAEFWGAPAMAGRKAAVVGPPAHRHGLIRIVELGNDFELLDPYQTLGWIALEIRVRTPDTMVEQLRGLPFKHTGGPGDSSTAGGAPAYRAAQFKGPSGEPLYFTQHTQLDGLVPPGPNNVGPLFIQTLAAHPYAKTRDFYQVMLGLKSRMEIDVPRRALEATFDLPPDSRYKMAAVRAPEFCSIQVDEYPDAVPARPAADGCLPPGTAMCTFATRDVGAVAAALKGAGLPFQEIPTHALLPSGGGRALACRGYSGEIVEFVDG